MHDIEFPIILLITTKPRKVYGTESQERKDSAADNSNYEQLKQQSDSYNYNCRNQNVLHCI